MTMANADWKVENVNRGNEKLATADTERNARRRGPKS